MQAERMMTILLLTSLRMITVGGALHRKIIMEDGARARRVANPRAQRSLLGMVIGRQSLTRARRSLMVIGQEMAGGR